MNKYYRKEVPETALTLSNGKKFKFEKMPDGYGYLSTGDAFLIAEMDAFVSKHRGGVSEITQEKYEAELKKNESLTPSERISPRNAKPKQVNLWPPRYPGVRNAANAGAENKQQPQSPQTQSQPIPQQADFEFRPRTGQPIE